MAYPPLPIINLWTNKLVTLLIGTKSKELLASLSDISKRLDLYYRNTCISSNCGVEALASRNFITIWIYSTLTLPLVQNQDYPAHFNLFLPPLPLGTKSPVFPAEYISQHQKSK